MTLREAKQHFERTCHARILGRKCLRKHDPEMIGRKCFVAYVDFYVNYNDEQGTFAVRFGFDRCGNRWECTMS